MVHVLQHADSPTWCVLCGRFDMYCGENDCPGGERRFDSDKPENYKRMIADLFEAV